MDELLVKYKPVRGYPDYRVGTDGSVWSRKKNTRGAQSVNGWHIITGGLDKDGYRKLILCKGPLRKYVRFNVLVLTTFSGAPPKGMKNPTAAHLDGDRTNNSIDNLRWCSQKENIAHKKLHGTHQAGESHPSSKLTVKQVKKIRSMRKAGYKWREIADSVGHKLPTVYAAGNGRNWKNV